MKEAEEIINKLIELKSQDTESSYSHIKNILKNQMLVGFLLKVIYL